MQRFQTKPRAISRGVSCPHRDLQLTGQKSSEFISRLLLGLELVLKVGNYCEFC